MDTIVGLKHESTHPLHDDNAGHHGLFPTGIIYGIFPLEMDQPDVYAMINYCNVRTDYGLIK